MADALTRHPQLRQRRGRRDRPAVRLRSGGHRRGRVARGAAGDGPITRTGACGTAAAISCGTSLDELAHASRPAYGWDDIVVADDVRAQLRELARPGGAARPRLRGVGLRRDSSVAAAASAALFAGPSGTGKTMAAEILAAHLRLDLYRIDLAGVVSKYIGETEKNLRRVFDAAERSGAILFFDEADALFGTRTEVRDSHDRYANLEINYLLQRMEDYAGLAILATNRRAALDAAFLRRLRFVIEFPFPWPTTAGASGAACFPPGADVDDVEYVAPVRARADRRQHPVDRHQRRIPRGGRGHADRHDARHARGGTRVREALEADQRRGIRPLRRGAYAREPRGLRRGRSARSSSTARAGRRARRRRPEFRALLHDAIARELQTAALPAGRAVAVRRHGARRRTGGRRRGSGRRVGRAVAGAIGGRSSRG